MSALPVSYWEARALSVPPDVALELSDATLVQHAYAGGVIEIWAVPDGVSAQAAVRAADAAFARGELPLPASERAPATLLAANDQVASDVPPIPVPVAPPSGTRKDPEAPPLGRAASPAPASTLTATPQPPASARDAKPSATRPASTSAGEPASRLTEAKTTYRLPAPAASDPAPHPTAQWPAKLQAELEALDARTRGDVGVYVYDLASGAQVSHRANEHWYLASMVKVPVALAVLQAVQRGELSLDDRMAVQASDYVDGAGQTNRLGPGQQVSVRFLLEQMIVESDNTATDMLIRRVGLDTVNALAQARVASGLEPVTTLADVRRRIYGEITPEAGKLSGRDFLRIRQQPSDGDRVREMLRITQAQPALAGAANLTEAYDRYYATNANAGRLDAFGDLLAQVAQGEVLDATRTAVLLDIMQTVRTGDRRIKAGLPAHARFAHKTGTQRARFCDGGIVFSQQASGQPLVVVACTRDDASLGRAERTLRGVGEALRDSGYFSEQGHS